MFRHLRTHAAIYARGGLIFFLTIFVLALPAYFLLPDEAPIDGELVPFPLYLWNRLGSTTLLAAFAFVAGALLAPTVRYFLAGKHPGLLLPLKFAFLSKTHRAVVAIAVIAALALIPISYLFQDGRFVDFIADSPGGLFALVTGILSVVGVYLTLHVVLEVHNTILSFEDFVRRAETLIDSTSESDCVQMMLHTPATGCLALKRAKWTRLSKRILKNDRKYSLTCLNEAAMKVWFKSYEDNLEGEELVDMQLRIEKGITKSRAIKDAINDPDLPISDDEREEIGVVEGEWSDLPQFYLIANDEKAIVVLPFFLPRPGMRIFLERQNVHMIGFETSNPGIISAVHDEIGITRTYILEKLARTTATGPAPTALT